MATYTYDVTLSANNRYLINRQEIPPLDLQSGNTYIFNVQAPGHPFYIKVDRVLGDGSSYDFQVTGNGADQGQVKIVLPKGPVPKLFYQDSVLLANGASLTNVQHIDRSIKHALGDQLPGFVSAEYPMFQRFMEAYYEWLSQPGNTDFNVQKLLESQDVDTSVDLFLEHLENEFLTQIPKDIEVDKRTLIKNIRSFYSSKGTEKSYEFLFNILFNEQVEFYYPKNDILRASDGKWSTVTSVRLLNDNNYDVFQLTGKTIQQDYIYVDPYTNIPETRIWAEAKVDRIIQFYLGDNLITEAYITNLTGLGDFFYSTSDDEADRQYVYYIDDIGNPIEFRIVPMLTTITVNDSGTGYSAGTLLQVDTAPGDSGVGAIAQISSIFQGSVTGINILNSGVNYQVNDLVQFQSSAEIGGSGAFAFVSDVSTSGMNYIEATGTQDIDYTGRGSAGSPVHFEKLQDILNDTPVTRTMYFSVHGPGVARFDGDLTNISDGDYGGTVKWDYFRVYIEDTIEEAEASTSPVIDLTDQPFIDEEEDIANDKVIRVEFSYSISGATYDEGLGETAEIGAVMDMLFLADGSIREIKLVNSGSGYRRVPTVQVVSETGSGAAVRARGDNIGKIKEVKVLNQNFGALYYEAPTIDLSNYGGGDASVTLGIGSIARHPGSFRNDDGHLSEAKYLQDNKYYQTFSYVLRTGLSIENYRDTIKKLVHPAGMELFGEVFITNNAPVAMFNNFQNDPNDLIVSQRLGGLQIPKYKKTIMLFKQVFADTVTYGGGIKAGQTYQRPTFIDKLVDVEGNEKPTSQKKQFFLAANLGIDPTDLQVYSFPVLSFPLVREVENIIIDNQVEITRHINREIFLQDNVEVGVYTFKKILNQDLLEMQVTVDDITSVGEREMHLLGETPVDVSSTYVRRLNDLTDETIDVQVTGLDAYRFALKQIIVEIPLDFTIDNFTQNYQREISIQGVADIGGVTSSYVRRLNDLTDETIDLQVTGLDTFRTGIRNIISETNVEVSFIQNYQREISIQGVADIKGHDSRRDLTILVGVGEIRDWTYPGQTIQDVQDEWNTIKGWARDLSLHVRIDSQLVGRQLRTEILNIILDSQDMTVDTFRTLEMSIDLETQTLNDVASQYNREINLLTDVSANVESFYNKEINIGEVADLTIDVTREIHRQSQTHTFMLMHPHSVAVTPQFVELKTNEIQILIDSVMGGADWRPVSTITGQPHENLLNTATLMNPTIELNADLTVDVHKEVHRHWTTHNYLLTSPREVEVIARPVEVKTNELTITIGLKEIRDYQDVLIGSLDGNSAIRALDPTTLIVVPRDTFYRNIPVEYVVKELSVPMVYVGVSTEEQRIEIMSIRQLDMKVSTTLQSTRYMRNQSAYNVKMQGRDEQNITNSKQMVPFKIVSIAQQSIGSFDPDNTPIRSIANSQLVTTSLTGYIRDSEDNIIGTL